MIPKIKLLRDTKITLVKKYDGDAGFDVFSDGNYFLWPHRFKKIPLGFALEIPINWMAMISERSGLASENGLFTIGNIIDSTYRGEVHAIVYNGNANETFQIKKGDKIAQLIILPCYTGKLVYTLDELSESERGSKGFGSTGMKGNDLT